MSAITEQEPVAVPNGYDLAFLQWFQNWGWRINNGLDGVRIWTNPTELACPFKVTPGMIERLAGAGKIIQIFPTGELWTECWVNAT